MMAGRTRRDERVRRLAAKKRVHRVDRPARSVKRRIERRRTHERIRIELNEPRLRRSCFDRRAISGVMGALDRVRARAGRRATDEIGEVFAGERCGNGAAARASLGMTGRRFMSGEGRVIKEERAHLKSLLDAATHPA